MNLEQFVAEFFSQYAYQPEFVYGGIVLFMTASSFGLPIPEEVTLVSAGLVAYMATRPDLYPPPSPDAVPVNMYTLAVVCFIAVLLSDLLIYSLGRFFGRKLVKTKFFQRTVGQERFDQINTWFLKYSAWACGIFRFTPGVRFPGHMSCGMMGVPVWKFIAIDGLAALVSVPTQVLLVAWYGEFILSKLQEFKLVLLGVIVVAVSVALIKRYLAKKKQATPSA